MLTRGELSGLVIVDALNDFGGIGKPAGIAGSGSCQVLSGLHSTETGSGKSVLAAGPAG